MSRRTTAPPPGCPPLAPPRGSTPLQALFQMEAAGSALDAVREEFETHRLGARIDGESYGDPTSTISAPCCARRSTTRRASTS
jgi:hypothetical protein